MAYCSMARIFQFAVLVYPLCVCTHLSSLLPSRFFQLKVFSAFASTLFLKLLLRGKSVDKLVGILLLFVYVALAIASFYHP